MTDTYEFEGKVFVTPSDHCCEYANTTMCSHIGPETRSWLKTVKPLSAEKWAKILEGALPIGDVD